MLDLTLLKRLIVNDSLISLPKHSRAHSCYGSSRLRRTYATAIPDNGFNSSVGDVAVLGGGITGLASAYYIAERLPHSQITLFEGKSRLGGWLRSTQIDVGNGNVVFEQGPRNLRPTRPNGWVTLDLVSMDSNLLNQWLIRMVRSTAWGWRTKY